MWSVVARRNGFWLLLIASLAFNAGFGTTFGVRTYRYQCGGGPGRDAPCQSIYETLNLTADQQGRMQEAREKLFRQVGELRQELTGERERLAGLLAGPDPDRAALAAHLDKIMELQRQAQWRVLEHLLEEKESLSPEQQETFNEIIRRRVCPCGGHGPESVPGDCDMRGASGHPCGNGCAGRSGN